jgi:hypothetical protein
VTTLDEVLKLLSGLNEKELKSFVYECLLRARQVMSVLGSPATDARLLDALAECRQGQALEQLRQQLPPSELEQLPESQVDDSHDSRYYAMRSLAPFYLISSGSAESEVGESAKEVAVSCWELFRDIEAHLRELNGTESELGSTEIAEQHQTLSTLSEQKRNSPDKDAISDLSLRSVLSSERGQLLEALRSCYD